MQQANNNGQISVATSASEWDEYGFHKVSGTRYDEDGYDRKGYDKDGYDSEGYDRDGLDNHGFDRDGYHADGYDIFGFDRNGNHKDTGTEYDQYGFDRSQINKFTGTEYGPDGYDVYGYDKDGNWRHSESLDVKQQTTKDIEAILSGLNNEGTLRPDSIGNYSLEEVLAGL